MTVEHQMSPLPLGTPSLMVGFKLMVQHDESLQVFKVLQSCNRRSFQRRLSLHTRRCPHTPSHSITLTYTMRSNIASITLR